MHFSRPSGNVTGDALDLIDLELRRLRVLVAAWRSSDPERVSGRPGVPETWEHGSVGKLVIEHTALLIGAERDVLRILDRGTFASSADYLRAHLADLVKALDAVYEVARGVHPVDLMANRHFSAAMDRLLPVLDEDLAKQWAGPDTAAVVRHVEQHRRRLRSARHIRSHSPSHPSGTATDRWFAPLLRSKVAFDRLRGYPWAESSSFGDTTLARQIDEMR